MPRKILAPPTLLLFSLLALPALAAEGEPPKGSPPGEPKERLSETSHKIRIGGQEIAYRALAGELLLRDEAEKPQALMFYTAYLAQGPKTSERPITFLFNGSPGSSAIWLHLGAFGPKRVRVDEMGQPGPPTDLVFVDPVSTGYSRVVPGGKAEPFQEVHGDVEAMCEFIRRFLTWQGRWDSPLFIAGESYGTIRGAAWPTSCCAATAST